MTNTQTAKTRILVVEDEKIIAIDLQIRLQQLGYEVVGNVTNGAEAIEILKSTSVDLALMDIMIDGDMDGVDTANIIAQDPQLDIPVIFLTAYADENTFRRALRSEPYSYLIKPMNENELDMAIKTAVQKHKLQRDLSISERRYRKLFDNSREAFIILDDEAKVVEKNASAHRMLQLLYPGKSIDHFFELFPSISSVEMKQKFQEMLALGDAKERYDLPLFNGGQAYLTYSISANFERSLHLATIRDHTAALTARKRIALLARFQTENPNPTLRISLTGNVLYANKQAETILAAWGNLDNIPDEVLAKFSGMSEQDQSRILQLRIDKSIYRINARLVPSDAYINLYFNDVTQLRRAQKVSALQSELLELVGRGITLEEVIGKVLARYAIFNPRSVFFLFGVQPLDGRLYSLYTNTSSELLTQSLLQLDVRENPCLAEAKRTNQAYGNQDIEANMPDGPCKDLLAASGLMASYILPVKSERGTLAYLLVYYPEKHIIRTYERLLAEMVVQVISVALERDINLQNLSTQARVFGAIKDAVVLVSHDHTVLDWNPRASELFQQERDNVIGKRLAEVQMFFEQETLMSELHHLKPGERQLKEFRYIRTDGTLGYAEVSIVGLDAKHRKAPAKLIVARSITQRKQIELALQENRANLKTLVDNTEDIILYLDNEMRLVTANKTFLTAFQVYTGLVVEPGQRVTFPLEGADPRLISSVAKCLGTALQGNLSRVELDLPESDSFPLTVFDVTFYPVFNDKHRVIGISIYARDITERKNSETELKKTNFELDSFVYRASHDLRAPLRSMLGLVNLLHLESDPDVTKRYLDLIEKSINKLDNFIGDLTNYSRNTRLEIKKEPVNFQAIINDVLENLRYMPDADHCASIVEIDETQTYLGDETRLKIILSNFISNAVKYQRLEIPDSYVKVKIYKQGNDTVLIVSDNGKGIDNAYLDRIFEMFYRASEESYGSGLGLYITKQVVDKLGAKLTVNSTLGSGTTFNIVFPG